MPDEIPFTPSQPPPAVLDALVAQTLIEGATLSTWWRRQSTQFLNSFMDVVQETVNNGESITQAITRIVGGTVEGVQVPGIMRTTRGKAGALVSTAINSIQTEALLTTVQDNLDVIGSITQVSTLDNRTSDICIAYSGQTWDAETLEPINGSTLPFDGGTPRHFNCRSRIIPVTKSFEELGIDLPEVATGTRASMDGQVPQDITFSEWLKGKSDTFVNKLLGPVRASLWRRGKITLTQLVDMRGNPMTIDQLEAKFGP